MREPAAQGPEGGYEAEIEQAKKETIAEEEDA